MIQTKRKKVDYIIVGDGFAAYFFAHQLIKNKKEFVLFSDGKRSASRVSAGIVNPVILKKFSTFWLAKEQISQLTEHMDEIDQYTGQNYLVRENIYRLFHDEKERELWQTKTQKEELRDFLDQTIYDLKGVRNEFGAGRVRHSARIDVDGFFHGITSYLKRQGMFVEELFDYPKLQGNEYGQLSFKNIVFCEGMGVRNNPFFHDIPVLPNKGHHLTVSLSKPMDTSHTIKKKHFLFPLSGGRYYYGGTYDRNGVEGQIDDAAAAQLKKSLSEFYEHDYRVEDIEYGMRPTVADRRPVLGAHQQFPHYFVFNGLGARGILNGSYFSRVLYEHIERGATLPPEVDIKRFH